MLKTILFFETPLFNKICVLVQGRRNPHRMKELEQKINIERIEQIAAVFGNLDANMRLIEKQYGVHVTSRDSEIRIAGEPGDPGDRKPAEDGGQGGAGHGTARALLYGYGGGGQRGCRARPIERLRMHHQ